jgi:hypothetical protein
MSLSADARARLGNNLSVGSLEVCLGRGRRDPNAVQPRLKGHSPQVAETFVDLFVIYAE